MVCQIMGKIEDLREVYAREVVYNSQYSISMQIESFLDLPNTEMYNKMIKQAHVLVTTCEKTQMAKAGIKILLDVKKYHKRNQDFGFLTNLNTFSATLYVLHMYLVRILRHPWRKEFKEIKTFNGTFKHVISENLAPSISKDLMTIIGFQASQDKNYYILQTNIINKQLKDKFLLTALDLFLSHAYSRMQGDPDLLAHLQGKPRQRPMGHSAEVLGNPKVTTEKRDHKSEPYGHKYTNQTVNKIRNSGNTQYSSLPNHYTRNRNETLQGSQTLPPASRHESLIGTRQGTSSNDRPGPSGLSQGSLVTGRFSEPSEPQSRSKNLNGYESRKNISAPMAVKREYVRNSSDSEDNGMEDIAMYGSENERMESNGDSINNKIFYPPPLVSSISQEGQNNNNYVRVTDRGAPDGKIVHEPPVDNYPLPPYNSNKYGNANNNNNSNRHLYEEINDVNMEPARQTRSSSRRNNTLYNNYH